MVEGEDAVRPIPDALEQPPESGVYELPESAVVYVTHAHKGAPIFICMGPGDHSVIKKEISPTHALSMAQLLIQAAARELGHPRKS